MAFMLGLQWEGPTSNGRWQTVYEIVAESMAWDNMAKLLTKAALFSSGMIWFF